MKWINKFKHSLKHAFIKYESNSIIKFQDEYFSALLQLKRFNKWKIKQQLNKYKLILFINTDGHDYINETN